MSIDEDKAQVRRLYAALNAARPAGNWGAPDAFIAPDYVYHECHEPSDPIRGRAGFR